MSKQKRSARKHFVYRKHPEHKKITLKRFTGWFLLMIFLSISVFLVEQNVTTFQASVIPTKHAPAFDGLVMPVQKTPDWVALSQKEWDMPYSEIPSGKMQKIPEYNASNLRMPIESLKWGDKRDDAIRNEKITYSVPYMGSYKLDGKEHSGSHLAVDIKIPNGTPIYAIGNGIIVKTSEQTYGFGKHVVIEHQNFPSFENRSNKTTYYSSYTHLGSVNVTEGSIIKKGEIIGYSGETGTATTPHLHFQIDKDTAPWHPYWPFTSKEASDAGLTFTQAVNAGLNRDLALKHTINPFLYIQSHSKSVDNYESVTDSKRSEKTDKSETRPNREPGRTEKPEIEREREPEAEEDTTVKEENKERENDTESNNDDESSSRYSSTSNNLTSEKVKNDDETAEEPESESEKEKTVVADNIENTDMTFDIIGDNTFIPDEDKTITIKAVTTDGKVIKDYVPDGQVKIEITRGRAVIKPNKLYYEDFENGVAEVTFNSSNENAVEFVIKAENITKKSNRMNPGLFADISTGHPNFQAISFLKNEGVINGYPDGSFKPENVVSRVEVLKFILEGTDSELKNAKSLPFDDTSKNEWYSDYLYTAWKLGIVDGYPDGSFKPTVSVNRVEFLKMLVESMNIDINPDAENLEFQDVNNDEWYAPYVKFAHEKNIIQVNGNKFNPTAQMKREEVAEAIYRVKMLTITGANIYTNDLKPA
jgi:hypothetical protein